MAVKSAFLAVAFAAMALGHSIPWPASSPASAGFDPAKLAAWRSSLEAHNTTGLLVVRRGKIALEWYAQEWNAEKPHGTASMAKALVGGCRLRWRCAPAEFRRM